MASLTWWTWVWVNSGSWWWTGRPGVLRFMGLQRVGHDWVTDLIWSDISVHLCHTIFVILNSEPPVQMFFLCVILFQELLESLQDSISPVVLSIWMVGERNYPSDLSQTRLGHHSTENQEGLNWKAPHHAFSILHLPLGGYAKSGSSFRKRKAGRCWRWLKGWLKLAHSLHEGVPVFILLHLEIGRSWRSG